jgi:branched-chain amino acid transport system permease protein
MVILAGIVISIGIWGFLTKTQIGIAMRAVAQHSEIATLQGINVLYISMLGMAIGCGLAATAGALMAPIYGINPYIGTELVMRCFIVLVLGGIGSFPGAVLASFLVGFTEAASANLLGAGAAKLLVYSLLLIVFLVRPMGLYGGQEWRHG